MLKYKTSKLTEAIDCYFDNVLNEADPAVTISDNDNSDIEASKNNLQHFLSNAFSDHSEDIDNVDVMYQDNTATINVVVKQGSDVSTLRSFYESKFELSGNESGSFAVVSSSDSDNGFTLNLALYDGTNDITADNQGSLYTLDDIEEIVTGTGASVVVEDIIENGTSDELVDLVNSNTTKGQPDSDDNVIEFIETSNEVDSLRKQDTISNESEHLGQTRKETNIELKPVNVDLSNIDNIVGKYVKIGDFFHEIIDVITYDDKYVINFAASTDGKQRGGQFEPGTIDEISNLQLFAEQGKINEAALDGIDYGDDEFVGQRSLDDIIGDVCSEVVEQLGDSYEYEQNGQNGDYTNTFYKDGNIVAEINDQEIEALDKQDMKKYIIDRIQGIKEQTYNYGGLSCPKCGSDRYHEIDDSEDSDGTLHFHYECQDCGYKEDGEYSKQDFEESEQLTEQVVPASELGFKHQELAKIEDEVALISKLKAEDPGNTLYTDLLDCFDKAIEVLKDSIGEEPVGTVVGKDDVAIDIKTDNKLGGSDIKQDTDDLGSEQDVDDLDIEDNVEEEI